MNRVTRLVTAIAAASLFPAVGQAAGEWASGGLPSSWRSQFDADAGDARRCDSNNVLLLRVRGSGETTGKDALGSWTFNAGQALVGAGWRVRDGQLDYTAANVPPASLVTTFLRSMFNSTDYVSWQLNEWGHRCPSRPILVSAYSQGNVVLRLALAKVDPSVRSQIVAVDLVSDPAASTTLDAGVTLGFPGQARRAGSLYISQADNITLGNGKRAKIPYPSEIVRVARQYCRTGNDIVCDNTQWHSLSTLAAAKNGGPLGWFALIFASHVSYNMGAIGTATGQRFIASRGTAPNPTSSTNGPTNTTGGQVTPDPGASSQTTDPQPPPASPTWAETTGGEAHTWTNYTNAGGSEGAVVPARTTIQIACRLAGFRVSNGNAWWYRIASPPWSGQYYVSADVFYNNGATSGSLAGTPYVDPAVPAC